MNYLTLCKVKVLISLLILIEGCHCCQVVTDRPIDEVLEENYKSPWLVFVVDLTLGAAKTQGLAGLAYGTLIHSRLVLTAAYPLANSKMKNLEVRTNCTAKNKKIVCVTGKVSFIIDSTRAKRKEKTIEDWVILMLDKSFDMSDRINVIYLAYNDDVYDKNCQIYHWQIVAGFEKGSRKKLKSTGVLHFPYNITLNGDEFELTEEGINTMYGDLDCLIQPCYDFDDELKTFITRISFMGSPIVCRHEDGTPIQVGFAAIVYEILGDTDKQAKIQSGKFIRLLGDTEKYIDPILGVLDDDE